MDDERVLDAIEVLNWLTQQAARIPEDRASATAMGATLAMANLYLTEYSQNLQRGADAYDALLSTARGEMKLRDRFLRQLAEAMTLADDDPAGGR